MTAKSQLFLMQMSENKDIILLATLEIIQLLQESSSRNADGTFKIRFICTAVYDTR